MVGITADSVTRRPPSVTAAGPTAPGVIPSPSGPPNLDTFVFNGEKDVAGGNVDAQEGLWVDPTGERLYTCRSSISVEDLFHFSMSPAHDISSLTFVNENNADGQPPRAIALQEDGSALFVYWRNPTNPDGVFKWPLSIDWDIDTKGSRTTLGANFSNDPRGLWFKPDGTELYLMDGIDNTVYQYTLPTPWDFTGSTQTKSFTDSGNIGTDLTFSSDGLGMYIVDAGADTVRQYNLGTAWDVSTAVFSGLTLSLPGGSGGSSPRGVALRGNFLYVCYNDNEFIEQFKTA